MEAPCAQAAVACDAIDAQPAELQRLPAGVFLR
jgi:hypothetical protein